MATHGSNDEQALLKLERALSNQTQLQQDAEDSLFKLRKSNIEKLKQLQVDAINRQATLQLEKEQEINEKLIKMGFDAAVVIANKNLKERLKALKAEEKESLKTAAATETEKIKKEYRAKRKAEKTLQNEIDKAEEARTKLKEKQRKKEQKELKSSATSLFSEYGNAVLGIGKNKLTADLTEELEAKGYTKEEAASMAKTASNQAQGQAIYDKFLNLINQLNGTINDIAYAQSEIDTRLQGSSNRKWLGSYWKAMSQDVIKYVGASPLVKQADVVSKLKEYVGRGISFDVEQRAFLQVISDKIATTFNAADGSLVKLVRIQQQDTTAARLGMESALTAFLNNMYETTEYMSEMAESVRSNIYEASALMTAKSATEFEYQVQKWMGSLFSVGFNTDLSSALGDLAAGNISSISDGGIGNLLVMAANKANLSIADILSDGLDASKTNQLMEAVVDYLGNIYNETKGSNILAQQYANVFGLKASDIKAAANLTTSITNIANQNLDYAGLMQQLTNMAGSMSARTSTGEMITNVIENFKYATANTLANSPTLYAIYTAANLLDELVGGIALPSVMGTSLNTTVADLMKVGVLAPSLLMGSANMLAGLGNNSTAAGMLRGFGITDKTSVVTRGTGQGLLVTNTPTTSESGSYIGNADTSSIKNQVISEGNEEAQTATPINEDEKTDSQRLESVDSNIQLIYNLLYPIINASGIKVISGDDTSWGAVIRDNQIY